MAQKKIMRHASALKANRQAAVRRDFNVQIKSKIRTLAKAVSKAISDKNVPSAKEQFLKAQSAWKKAANRGIVHKNAASRIISRLSSRLAAISK